MRKTSSRARARDGQIVRLGKTQTAQYIAQMATEMADMANTAGLPLLAHLLKMVQVQAEMESKTPRNE